MGGGGVMRTAAKAAAGIAGGAARYRHPSPVFATAAAGETAAAAPTISVAAGEATAVAAAGAQRPAWEVDDWEFADWRVVDGVEEKPRLVFAPPPAPPTLEEAEEATSDLRDAIERVYFSETPHEVVKEQDMGLIKLKDNAMIPSMPRHVVEAFTLLKSSPEAQSVVASLASDKNVWEAVLKNEKVMEFYETQEQNLAGAVPEDSDTVESPEKCEDAPQDSPPPASGWHFTEFVDTTKSKVMELVGNISNFFQDMFRASPDADTGTSSSTGKDGSTSFFERVRGKPLVAIAIAVILVVLFKRA